MEPINVVFKDEEGNSLKSFSFSRRESEAIHREAKRRGVCVWYFVNSILEESMEAIKNGIKDQGEAIYSRQVKRT